MKLSYGFPVAITQLQNKDSAQELSESGARAHAAASAAAEQDAKLARTREAWRRASARAEQLGEELERLKGALAGERSTAGPLQSDLDSARRRIQARRDAL